MDICNAINGSKLAWGFAAICVNLGSRYVIQDVTKLQESILSHALFKRFVMFCIVFMSTRDLLLSAAITAIAWVFLGYILNESSAFCLAPGLCRSRGSGGPTGQMQNLVSRQMYAKALDTVTKFQQQHQHQHQNQYQHQYQQQYQYQQHQHPHTRQPPAMPKSTASPTSSAASPTMTQSFHAQYYSN